MKLFKTLAIEGLRISLILLRIICALLALFYIFGAIWFLETWAHERFRTTIGIITSLIICALFPITGRGSFINRIFCPLASCGLIVSSLCSYKINEELAYGTNISDGAKHMAIELMVIAILYMMLTLKDIIGLKSKAHSSTTPQ